MSQSPPPSRSLFGTSTKPPRQNDRVHNGPMVGSASQHFQRLEREKDRLQKECADKDNKIRDLHDRVAALEQQKAATNRQLNQQTDDVAKLKDKEVKLREQNDKIKELNDRLRESQEQISLLRREHEADLATRAAKTVEAIGEWKALSKQSATEAESARAEKETIITQMSEIRRELDQMNHALSSRDATIVSLQTDHSQARAQVDTLERDLQLTKLSLQRAEEETLRLKSETEQKANELFAADEARTRLSELNHEKERNIRSERSRIDELEVQLAARIRAEAAARDAADRFRDENVILQDRIARSEHQLQVREEDSKRSETILESRADDLKKLELRNRQLTQQLTDLHVAHNSKTDELAEAMAKIHRLHTVEQVNEDQDKANSDLRRELADRVKEVARMERENLELRDRVAEQEAALSKAHGDATMLSNNLLEVQKAKRELEETLASNNAALHTASEQHAESLATKEKMLTEVTVQLHHAQQTVQSLEAMVASSRKAMDEADAQYNAVLSKKQADGSELLNKVAELKEEVKQKDELITEHKNMIEQMTALLSQERKSSSEQIDQLSCELQAVKAAQTNQSAHSDEVHRALEAEVNDLKRRIEEADSSIHKTTSDFNSITKELLAAQESKTKISLELDAAQREVSAIKAELSAAKRQITVDAERDRTALEHRCRRLEQDLDRSENSYAEKIAQEHRKIEKLESNLKSWKERVAEYKDALAVMKKKLQTSEETREEEEISFKEQVSAALAQRNDWYEQHEDMKLRFEYLLQKWKDQGLPVQAIENVKERKSFVPLGTLDANSMRSSFPRVSASSCDSTASPTKKRARTESAPRDTVALA